MHCMLGSCAKTTPVQQGALHCSCILSELQLSAPPSSTTTTLCVYFLEMTPHIWISGDCCVRKLFIEHLQRRSGPQRGALAASWKEVRCLPSVLCEPRKTVSRGGLQERPSVALFPACKRLLFQVPAEVVPLSTAHLSTSGRTDCVWLFKRLGEMGRFNKTHTDQHSPRKDQQSHPLLALSAPNIHKHTHGCSKISL